MDTVFILKKFVSRLIFPVPIVIYFLLLGLAMLFLSKTPQKKRAAKVSLFLGTLLLYTFASSPLPNFLIENLEMDFKPFTVAKLKSTQGAEWIPTHIVVLSADHSPDKDIPFTARLGPNTTARLNEGLRLFKQFPNSKLVFTGGKIFEKDSFVIAEDMARVAQMWGVPESSILLETQSRDTKGHVQYLTPLLKNKNFLLVTSASHMKRALALFRHAGLEAYPAPTQYQKMKSEFNWNLFIPNAGNLAKTEGAFYEYLGLAWAKLRGQL